VKEEIVRPVPVTTRRQSSNLNSSQNVSDGMKRLSSSSQLREGSSQLYGSSPFRNYQGNSGSGGSQNYNPLFESRYFMNNDPDHQNQTFLSGIRQL
jgi:hypothetical protein